MISSLARSEVSQEFFVKWTKAESAKQIYHQIHYTERIWDQMECLAFSLATSYKVLRPQFEKILV